MEEGGREGGAGLTLLAVMFWLLGVELKDLSVMMVIGGARGWSVRAFARMDRRRRGSILRRMEVDVGGQGGEGGEGREEG